MSTPSLSNMNLTGLKHMDRMRNRHDSHAYFRCPRLLADDIQ